jgi:hypothetical protein
MLVFPTDIDIDQTEARDKEVARVVFIYFIRVRLILKLCSQTQDTCTHISTQCLIQTQSLTVNTHCLFTVFLNRLLDALLTVSLCTCPCVMCTVYFWLSLLMKGKNAQIIKEH